MSLAALTGGSGTPGKMTRRLAATTLVGQGMTVFFGALVARQFEVTEGDPEGLATTYLYGGIALALLCVLTSGLLRRRAGIWLGWLCQGLTLATAVVLPAMAIVAVVFGALWWLCLSQGQKMDELTARFLAEQEEGAAPDAAAPQTDDTTKDD
ncbi:DUF4233 domain-containing protein [Ornithinimicrobium sediminis]|uniref:DUF4233 domain-containing protein n=1 Tax=Ornithinimicrobium sediminis TaxID=2904603 RepID=UPI001E59D80D|nr:DUF4233 domain-containing protein [Ornithinimicrobium sediminis]MCE0485373.1 DUF4233 domain-containing protein [Ornithinimicrobium sediminis]